MLRAGPPLRRGKLGTTTGGSPPPMKASLYGLFSAGSISDPVHACGRVVDDLTPVFLCEPAKRLLDELLRPWPDGGSVRVVRGPHDVVCPIAVELSEKDRLVNKGRVHLPLDVLARLQAQLRR